MTLSLSRAGRLRPTVVTRAPLMSHLAVWQQRRELSRLSPARLRDLGISETDAAREAARSFWDLP